MEGGDTDGQTNSDACRAAGFPFLQKAAYAARGLRVFSLRQEGRQSDPKATQGGFSLPQKRGGPPV